MSNQNQQSLYPWPSQYGRNPGALQDAHGKDVQLFTPFRVGSLQVKNRIVVSPMCMYSSPDGKFTDYHLVHLGSYALGGAGLIFTEATGVAPEGRISPYDAGLWSDAQMPGLERIVRFVHEHRAAIGIQLAHAGRKACTDAPWMPGADKDCTIDEKDPRFWQPVGASPIPWNKHHIVPRELTLDEIQNVIKQFVSAAERAAAVGMDVIEVHGAHGYLISSFLSHTSNHRQDQYGGSLENRARLLLEIVKALREGPWKAPKPLFVRISCHEWVPSGWSVDDSVQLAKWLKAAGVDVVDCSSGGNHHAQKIEAKPSFQVPFAERVRKEAGLATMAVGIITQAHQAEEIVQKGQADLVALARELLRDPSWPVHAAHELGVDVYWPPQRERAKPKL